MKLIPIVVLLDEECLPLLDAQVVEHAEALTAFGDDFKRENGWDDTMLVGGSILGQALRLAAEELP